MRQIRVSREHNGLEIETLLARPLDDSTTRIVLLDPESIYAEGIEWFQLYVSTELLERFCITVAERLANGHGMWESNEET